MLRSLAAVAALIFAAYLLPHQSIAQDTDNATIQSVAESIYSANGQARLGLVEGVYITNRGSTEFRFEIPSEMSSTLRFRFEDDVLVSGRWEFQRAIIVQIRSGNKCVRLSVKRFEYGEGGFLDGGSDQTIVPDGPCRESEPLSRLDDFLRLSTDTGDFFTGRAFVAFDDLTRCVDADCDATEQGLPIRSAVFYSSRTENGEPLPGFGASFRPRSSIILPDSGFLVLGAGSGASFKELSYDLETDTGSAQLTEFKVTLADGLIVGGDTILRIRPGSEMIANGFDVEKDDAGVHITGATLSAALGQGTSIALTRDDDRLSTLNLESAAATLSGLEYVGVGDSSSLSILRGQVNSRVESAELWLTDRNSLRFGYTTIDLTLGCPETSDASACRPVQWSDDGLQVTGIISNFATSLTGGSFNLTEVGDVQLKSGQIAADRLDIDTSDETSPITGKVNVVEVVLEGQNLMMDDATSIRVAQSTARSTNLVFVKGEALPVGTATLSGSISRLEGGKLDEVQFTAGAEFEVTVERAQGDDPAIADGRIDGAVQVAMSEGNTASARLKVSELRYYRGYGEASLELTVDRASYLYSTLAAHESKNLALVEAEINLRSADLAARLVQPLRIGPTRMKASGKQWRIEPIVGTAFLVEIGIARQELVYAPIRDKLLGSTICAPKVTLSAQRPRLSGKIDIFASDSATGVRVYDGDLTPGIDAEADDRGCSDIGAAVCFLVGSAFGGFMGGAALGVLCRDTIEEGERDLEKVIRDESMKKVQESEFNFSG